MKSMKKLLLIVLLFTTLASGSPDNESSEEMISDGGRRAAPMEECFCLSRHPMMVPVVDYLDSDGHGLNRLVVYLYRDKKTGQIHAYVPGVENQRKFPDISLDLYGNEIFVVNEELTVTAVFDKSKNVIPLSVPMKSSQEPAPDGNPAKEPEIAPHQLLVYDFSNGNIQTHTDTSAVTHPQTNLLSHPHIPTQEGPDALAQTDTQSHLQGPINSESYTQVHPDSQGQIHSLTPQTQSQGQIYSLTPQTQPQGQIYSLTPQTQPHGQIHSLTPQSHPQNSHLNTDINGGKKTSSIGGQFHYAYNSVNIDNKVTDGNIFGSTPSPNHGSHHSSHHGSHHSPHHGNHHHSMPSTNEISDDSVPNDSIPIDSIPVDTASNEGRPGGPINIDSIPLDTVPVHEYPVDPIGSDTLRPHTLPPAHPRRPVADEDAISAKRVSAAFDAWFKGQIKKVRDEQLTAHYVLNVKTLKASVEKILQENHIQFAANGKLQDSHGNIISFSRLKLRPVLIGDSIGYEKLKHREKYVFPRDLNYLEAILITVSYPPKILGIVPLRKVTLPQILQNRPQISQNDPQISQHDPQISQNGPQISQNGPQISQNGPQILQNSQTPPKLQASSFTTAKTPKKAIIDKANTQPHQPLQQTTPKRGQQTTPKRGQHTTPKRGLKNNKKVGPTVQKEYNITFQGAGADTAPSPKELENIFGKPPSPKENIVNKAQVTTEAPVDGRKSFNSEEVEDGNKQATANIFKSLLTQTLSRLRDFFPLSGPPEKEEKEDSSENPLGFRIIGGDPATISGKMLNNRGRSGFIN